MEPRDTFLARWSRLKRGANAAAADDTAPDAAPAPAEEPPLPEGKTLEDLLAELPKVEDLVPGQSLAAFMQPFVPTAIRNAALQRMWLLDPAISGYVDPALDYAHDYNALCAAPGFGPMETSQETISEVAEMFDRALGRAVAVEESRPVPDPNADHCGKKADQSMGQANVAAKISALQPAPHADAVPQNGADAAPTVRPASRRHGGALPG